MSARSIASRSSGSAFSPQRSSAKARSAKQLDVQAAELQRVARARRRAASGSSARAPVLRGDGRVSHAPARAAPRRCGATARPCGSVVAASSGVDLLARARGRSPARKRRACRRTWSARLAMHSRGRRRATPTASSAPSSSSARCSAPSAAAMRAMRAVSRAAPSRAGRCAPARRAGWRAAPPASSGGRAPTARRRAAAASMQVNGRAGPGRLGVGQRRAQQLLGQQHLAFPQVG